MRQQETNFNNKIAQDLKDMKIIFRFDIADMKLTQPQAMRQQKIQMKQRGYPDLFLCEPRGKYHGMYIEVKKSESEVFKKDGGYKQKKVYKNGVAIYDHIQEQVKCQDMLRKKGYHVVWGFGYVDSMKKIHEYLNLSKV